MKRQNRCVESRMPENHVDVLTVAFLNYVVAS